MNPRYFFRASLGLLVLVILGAAVLATGAATGGNAEPIAAVSDANRGATTSTEARERIDAQAAAHRANAVRVATRAASDKEAADLRQLYSDLELQAYEAEIQRQADEAAAAEAAQTAAFYAGLEKQAKAEAAAAAPAPAPAASGSRGSGVPADSYWDAMANCETGGNWGMSGRSFSGGVGFANTTWNAWGGQEFASNAGNATREQQIIVANRVATQGYGSVAPVGYSGWGCVRTIGYP